MDGGAVVAGVVGVGVDGVEGDGVVGAVGPGGGVVTAGEGAVGAGRCSRRGWRTLILIGAVAVDL